MKLPAPLKVKDYRNLFIGQTVSQLGDSVYYLVFLFLADSLAKDPRVTGLVALLQALPFVLFGPLAGVAADRFDRRKLMLSADIASTVLMGGLALSALWVPVPPIPILCAAAFCMSTINVFFMPARSAAIPKVVGQDLVQEATGLAMMSQQLMGMLGLGLSAGVLAVVFAKFPGLFFMVAAGANAATFLVSAVFIARLPGLIPDKSPDEETGPIDQHPFRHAWGKVVAESKAGLAAIKANPVTRIGLPISAVSTIFMSGFMVAYLQVNREWYDGKFTTLAWLELGFVVPMAIFSLFAGGFKVKRMGLTFTLMHVVLGVLVALFALCRPYWAFMALNAVCGIILPYLIVPFSAFLQTEMPDEVRGRVNATWNMVAMGAQPLGLVLTGFLLATAGTAASFVVMGLGMAIAGAAGFLNRPFVTYESKGPQAA